MYNRKIDYLRISVTDRCNLRCVYCVPRGGIVHKAREEILTFKEILRLANIFASLGIKKIRLTGGEPLVRKEVVNLVKSLAGIEGIEDISLTTNGTLLSLYAEKLRRAGIKRINISLDTLKEKKFKKIARNDSFHKVLEGIDKAKEAGFYPLKLNVVVMKGINGDEIVDFLEFAISKGLILRFIEFMKITPLWRADYFLPIEEVKEICKRRFVLTKLEYRDPGPAEYYRIENRVVGFIRTEEANCGRCTRLRLTSMGELKVCLYESEGVFLRDFLRGGVSDEGIKAAIETRMQIKGGANFKRWSSSRAYMYSVGG